MKIVELTDVHMKFQRDRVLNGVSFSVDKGDFCILIGHNGAGKSTILNLITQNEFHDDGLIKVFGMSLEREAKFFDKKIGFVHEKINFKVPFHMNKMVEIYKQEFPNWDNDFFYKMIEDRKIPLDKHYGNYSCGQKMQLALIMALARKPELLLVDEVTSVLDIAGQKYFLSLLRDLTLKGTTVILTTNMISEAQNICNKIVYLKEGHVQFAGNKETFFEPYLKLEIPNTLFSYNELNNVKATLIERTQEFSYLLFEKDMIVDKLPPACRSVPVSVEDVFLHLYKYKNENAA